jgi:hypothetical protein
VNLVLTAHKRTASNEPQDEIKLRVVEEAAGQRSFGRFLVYLLIMLARMKLAVPDLGRYLDPSLPLMVVRES